MTDEYEWYRAKGSEIHWLRRAEEMNGRSYGLVCPFIADDRKLVWEIGVWIPREETITTMTHDTPVDEVLGTAKMLILLTLKQRGLV